MDIWALKENLLCNIDSFFVKLETALKLNERDALIQAEKVASIEADLVTKDCTIQTLTAERNLYKDDIEILRTNVKDLQNSIKRIEEENTNFKKVSQIIAYEKENSKLKEEIKSLNNKLAKVESGTKSVQCVIPTQQEPIVLQQTREPVQDDIEDDVDLAVFEKKINKMVYYVSDDDAMRIFTKTPEGDIGDELGRLVNVDGKLKPLWI